VTAYADVVLPVAPPAEKGGTFLNWEGRWREFPQALTSDALSDGEVLDSLASAADVWLGLRGEKAGYAELAQLGGWEGTRAEKPEAHTVPPAGEMLLSTWSMLLDRGRLLDGEPYLAGTAHRSVARMSPATASQIGLVPGVENGATVTVSNDRGEITLPLAVTPMPDGVVWLPSNSPGSAVRSRLAAGNGDPVAVRVTSDQLMGA
jgi:NADH-quinone oxidoreductase subunit G